MRCLVASCNAATRHKLTVFLESFGFVVDHLGSAVYCWTVYQEKFDLAVLVDDFDTKPHELFHSWPPRTRPPCVCIDMGRGDSYEHSMESTVLCDEVSEQELFHSLLLIGFEKAPALDSLPVPALQAAE